MSTGSVLPQSSPPAPPAPPVVDPEAPPLLSMREVLRVPLLRRLWYAQIISVFGDFLALFAVISFFTFQLQASARHITGVQIAYLLPIAVLGVLAGVFVDRWPAKTTLVASDLVRAGLVLLFLFARESWHFYAILGAISMVSSFFGPAQGVAIRAAVPLHGLRSANALMQQVMFGMRIVGPAVAAYLVASFGVVSCYVLDCVSFIGSALLISSVAFAKRDAPATSTEGGAVRPSGLARIWLDTKEGIDFIVHHAGLLFVVLAMASGMFVLGCFGPLIAVFVRENLHETTGIFGIASALIGVGLLAGINVVSAAAKNLKNETLVYRGLAGIAAGLMILAGGERVWTTFLGDFIIGFAVAGIIIPAQTMIQQETPPALLGRVGATVMSMTFAAQISGLVLSGILAEQVGVENVFVLCAVMLGALIGAGYLWRRPRSGT
jgi:DHA3 family macrolide efflux protein-like MFS transporter